MGLIQGINQPSAITASTGYPTEAHTAAGVAVPVNIPGTEYEGGFIIKARIEGNRPAINSSECNLIVTEVRNGVEGKYWHDGTTTAEEAEPYLRALGWHGTCRDGILIAYYTIGH